MGQISVLAVLVILFIHWVADFIFQTDEEARGKSTSFYWLTMHTFKYSTIWVIPILFLFKESNKSGIEYALASVSFGSITFIIHTIQDYFTSRLNKKLWEAKNVHWFFVSIGFDQFLHFVQLILTLQIINNYLL